jgi:glycogen debranching enzyme
MAKIKQIEDEYYVLATSTYADDRVRVLNHGNTFGVFDRWGDVQPIGTGVQGLYHEGTRYVSDFEFRIHGERPLLLSSTISENNEILTVDLTNPEMKVKDEAVIPQSKIHVFRTKYLRQGQCYESIKLANYDTEPYEFDVVFSFVADYKDIFEIRGKRRKGRGEILPSEVKDHHCLKHRYRGLDRIIRQTVHHFTPAPDEILPQKVTYRLSLKPKQVFQIQIKTGFQSGEELEEPPTPLKEEIKMASAFDSARAHMPYISSSNEQFNHWLNRSKTDLVSLIADTPWGKYPYAGIPWFNTAFGRDGIITAFEVLWLAPELARDVLFYLSKTQATKLDPFMDAEPGKIMHETRKGEMAALGEIPFGMYYGTVDATPLFVMLAGAYFKRSGDLDSIRQIWPNIKKALAWIAEYGDIDGDGFLEYQKKSEGGLIHQGWKDADDAVSHEDGSLAITPMALCEVQGYVYDAKRQASLLAAEMGEQELAERLQEEARDLKKKFNEAFWDEALGTFVIGLDGHKRPCRVKTSNAGQCLFTGIVDEKHAARLAETLMSQEMFSGWGIRTLASDASRYNPMSYHNGTVWPHDTALTAYGLALYGFTTEAMEVFRGLYEAAMHIDMQRLPELFCGFDRRPGESPTTYPVACSPQAWAVASVFILLKACLRIEVNALQKRVTMERPVIPDWIKHLRIHHLPTGEGTLDLELTRHANHKVSVVVKKKSPDWEVQLIQ